MVAACTIMMLALHSVECRHSPPLCKQLLSLNDHVSDGSPPIPSVKGCYIVKGSIETIFIDLVLLSVFEISMFVIHTLSIWPDRGDSYHDSYDMDWPSSLSLLQKSSRRYSLPRWYTLFPLATS